MIPSVPREVVEGWARRLLALLIGVAGAALALAARSWRGFETSVAAHSIGWVSGQSSHALPGLDLVIVRSVRTGPSALWLTGSCSVSYLLAFLLIVSAPLPLIPRLSRARAVSAVALAAGIIFVTNIARLTFIGAAIAAWGPGTGFALSHTYLGSTLSFVGAALAGMAFVGTLLLRPHNAPTDASIIV